jgi:RNA polymerase sigma-70 factor (ECF subfamily)
MTTYHLDTDALLEPAAAGDEVALGRLLERHRGRLRRMIWGRMDHRLAPRIDPSDVIQEALADACRKLNAYARERPLPFYPWLRRLAAERLIQAHRRHIKVAARSVRRELAGRVDAACGSGSQLIDRVAASGASPSEDCGRREDREWVRGALDGLSAVDREVLVLRYLEDLPFAEVAAALGISESAAKVRHFRALDRVRRLKDVASGRTR